ncbi:MAG TPA: YeeE/YedE family protein [Rhodospirillaceae bacterium]|nr:YeeE/YedE family protein [Rhodospirillaceae bacterium]
MYLSAEILAIILGLSIGTVVGVTAFASNFCAVGAVADILFAKDWRRMRTWMLAGGIAIIGAQTLETAALVNLGSSPYLIPRISWLALIIGGTTFGFGMSLASGCVNRELVRTGAGSLKSLITIIVIGIFAAMTASGILKPLNDYLSDFGDSVTLMAPGFDRFFAIFPGIDGILVRWVFTLIFGGGLIWISIKDKWFRASKDQLFGGLIIGLTIPAAWLAVNFLNDRDSAVANYDALNFIAPLGQSLSAALVSGYPVAIFGIFALLGVPIGSFLCAAFTQNLSLETFSNPSDLPHNVIGGALMGFGGTLSIGCTFGQGLSGLSTLSVGSMLVITAIWFGCIWGIRYFENGSVIQGLLASLPKRRR